MNGTILFPYNAKSTSLFAYYFAIELARKINHNLRVVSTYQSSDLSKSFLRRIKNDESTKLKKQLHLKLLELNGLFFEAYNQWGIPGDIKINCVVKPDSIEDILLNLIKQKSGMLLLIDHKTLSEKLLPTGFINKIHLLDFKLWVIPHLVEGLKTKPKLCPENFYSNNKELFREYFCFTKLYNIPGDLNILKSEFRTTELAC